MNINRPKLFKLLAIVVGAIVVIVLVTQIFGNKSDTKKPSGLGGLASDTTGQTPTTAGSSGAAAGDTSILSLLRNLSTLKLDSSILSNPAYDTLEDTSIVLPPVSTQGRRNPFVSGGATAAPAATTPTTPAAPGTVQ